MIKLSEIGRWRMACGNEKFITCVQFGAIARNALLLYLFYSLSWKLYENSHFTHDTKGKLSVSWKLIATVWRKYEQSKMDQTINHFIAWQKNEFIKINDNHFSHSAQREMRWKKRWICVPSQKPLCRFKSIKAQRWYWILSIFWSFFRLEYFKYGTHFVVYAWKMVEMAAFNLVAIWKTICAHSRYTLHFDSNILHLLQSSVTRIISHIVRIPNGKESRAMRSSVWDVPRIRHSYWCACCIATSNNGMVSMQSRGRTLDAIPFPITFFRNFPDAFKKFANLFPAELFRIELFSDCRARRDENREKCMYCCCCVQPIYFFSS